ncbi:MAG TPA: TGS domain-containing protein, partial [Kiloniellaceae bacterium]|nr:TGS domain-containing protein [Kiloniellaceae bacterium]
MDLTQAKQISITLPDGSAKTFDGPVTGAEVAASIGPGLAKAALAIKVDGVLKDLAAPIAGDAAVEIVTAGHEDSLELLRHDCAHVLAEAAQELYPDTQVTFGPAIENGFYYDFARATPFTPEDLAAIEQRMHEIVDRDETITREVWDRDDAIRHFMEKGEKYKAEHIETLPRDAEISIYRQGNWLDLCTGPHLPSTKKLGHAFKLTKVSGAYWRGDARNEQLQRVYGTCWETEKQLKAYLTMVEEAEKRDHRRLGREMNLFHLQEEAVGSVFWHPKSWALYRTVED